MSIRVLDVIGIDVRLLYKSVTFIFTASIVFEIVKLAEFILPDALRLPEFILPVMLRKEPFTLPESMLPEALKLPVFMLPVMLKNEAFKLAELMLPEAENVLAEITLAPVMLPPVPFDVMLPNVALPEFMLPEIIFPVTLKNEPLKLLASTLPEALKLPEVILPVILKKEAFTLISVSSVPENITMTKNNVVPCPSNNWTQHVLYLTKNNIGDMFYFDSKEELEEAHKALFTVLTNNKQKGN